MRLVVGVLLVVVLLIGCTSLPEPLTSGDPVKDVIGSMVLIAGTCFFVYVGGFMIYALTLPPIPPGL